jgi:hypothetical protein
LAVRIHLDFEVHEDTTPEDLATFFIWARHVENGVAAREAEWPDQTPEEIAVEEAHGTAEDGPVPPGVEQPAAGRKRRGRKSNAEKAVEAQVETAPVAPVPEAVPPVALPAAVPPQFAAPPAAPAVTTVPVAAAVPPTAPAMPSAPAVSGAPGADASMEELRAVIGEALKLDPRLPWRVLSGQGYFQADRVPPEKRKEVIDMFYAAMAAS